MSLWRSYVLKCLYTCLLIGLRSACWSKLKALAMPTPKCSWLGSTWQRSKPLQRASNGNSGDAWMSIVCHVLHFQLPGTNQTCFIFSENVLTMTRPGTYQVLQEQGDFDGDVADCTSKHAWLCWSGPNWLWNVVIAEYPCEHLCFHVDCGVSSIASRRKCKAIWSVLSFAESFKCL